MGKYNPGCLSARGGMIQPANGIGRTLLAGTQQDRSEDI